MLTVNRKPKFANRKPKVIFGFETEPNRNRNSLNRTEPKTENLETDQPLVKSLILDQNLDFYQNSILDRKYKGHKSWVENYIFRQVNDLYF